MEYDTPSYADTIEAEIVGAQPNLQPTAMIPITHGSSGSGMMAAYAPMIAAAAGISREAKAKLASAKWIGSMLGRGGFYEFPVGGKPVSGPSIDLAQALAQEWGGIAYQVEIVGEEASSSGGKRVHLRAVVLDLKAVVMCAVDQVVSTSAPSGGFAKKADQAERWHAMQLQSAASKIVRNAILRVLPSWYVDAAYDAAVVAASARALNGKPIGEVRANTVRAFQEFGVTATDLEAYVGQAVDLWAVPQIEIARDLYRDLKNGRQTAEQLRAAAAPAPAGSSGGSSALGGRARTEALRTETRTEQAPSAPPAEPTPLTPPAGDPGPGEPKPRKTGGMPS